MPKWFVRFVLTFSVWASFFAAIPSRCQALEEIEFVSKERAKALGLKVTSNAAGPDAVRVVLEFEAKGELKDYSRVALEMQDEGKLLLSSTLREDKSAPGRVVVSFAADRTRLDQLTMKVVVQHSARGRTGHVIKVKEFVDLEKLR